MNSEFFKAIKKAAKALGGDAHVETFVVGHGASEEVIVVSEPYVPPTGTGSTNRIVTMQDIVKEVLDKLPKP